VIDQEKMQPKRQKNADEKEGLRGDNERDLRVRSGAYNSADRDCVWMCVWMCVCETGSGEAPP
jgi:hypothetical protein